MKRLMVIVAAVLAAGLFGLFCMSVLSIITAITVPNVAQSRWVSDHPALVAEPNLVAINTVNPPSALSDLYAFVVAMTIVLGLFGLSALLVLKKTLQGAGKSGGDESADIQALHRLGRGLESRMEALETILLERGRSAP